MTAIRLGCQLSAWQASGKKFVGQMPHIFERVSEADFAGVSMNIAMLGAYYDDPEALVGVLDRYDLALSALVLTQEWRGSEETHTERQAAEKVFHYLEHFSDARLVLVQRVKGDRQDIAQRQVDAIACFHTIAERAAGHGIATTFHPESSSVSLFRDAADYYRLVQMLDPRVLGLALDTGHAVRAGVDVIEFLRTYRPIVRHVHLRDVTQNGIWCPLGKGIIDFEQIMRLLQDSCYTGWVMIEDASSLAESDPDKLVLQDGAFADSVLRPLLSH